MYDADGPDHRGGHVHGHPGDCRGVCARLWRVSAGSRLRYLHVGPAMDTAHRGAPVQLARCSHIPARLLGGPAGGRDSGTRSPRRSAGVGRARHADAGPSGGGSIGHRGLLRACYALLPLAIAYVRRPPRSDELYVANLAVDPEYQNRGIGRRLLAAAAQRAQERGYRRLSLHVAAANAPALHLYESAGFCPEVTIRPPYRGPLGIPAFIAMRSG